MIRDVKELLTNVNLYFRLAECIVCFVGIILFLANVPSFWDSYIWLIHGWFIASLAFVVAYLFEQPNFGLEVVIIGLYYIPIMEAFTREFSIKYNWCPIITAILMTTDLFFLIVMREK